MSECQNENIVNVSISNSLQKHYIDYAMSVITDRVLPDVRDGLKPVQRRVLYTLYDLGLTPEKSFKKSARIVGDCLGKLHPHGDQSVYEAMIKMAQDFSIRYPIVNVHGNVGSIDGDSAAAMRYTESKMSRYGNILLNNINKDTVDFLPNFDGEELEPSVLPCMIPNLLANGTSGIAVGMASNIPPHNLSALYDALIYIVDCLLNDSEIDELEIINIVKAPDFPTGGKIINSQSIVDGYLTGQGKVTVRGTYEIIKNDIIITEIPYKVNKANLVKKIDELVRNAKTTDKKKSALASIKEIRDESDKSGMRIVVELKKDANPQLVIKNLLKYTDLQTNISINSTVLVDKSPKVISLFEALIHFLEHCCDVLTRKTAYELNKNIKRLNIVDGVLLACSSSEMINSVINIIRESDDINNGLITLGFNQEQAEYIAEMKIKNLSKKSEEKFSEEKSILETNISKENDILSNQKNLFEEIKLEFNDLKEKYGDDRKTEIINENLSLDEEDLIKEETLIITITDTNLIKSVEEKEYNTQRRGGKGSNAGATKEDENIKYMFTANSKDSIMFFTNLGRVYPIKAYKINKSNKNARGKSIYNYITLNAEAGEYIVNVISANLNLNNVSKSLLMVTKKGLIKRLSLENLSASRSFTKIIEFRESDELTAVLLVSEGDNVIINTAKGLSSKININKKSVRPSGRTSQGVKGIKIKIKNDYVVDASLCDKPYLLSITKNGLGKRTPINEFNTINRGGQGTIGHKINDKTGEVACALTVNDEDDVFIATEQGKLIRVNVNSVSVLSRNTAGVKLLTLSNNDCISSASLMVQQENQSENENLKTSIDEI